MEFVTLLIVLRRVWRWFIRLSDRGEVINVLLLAAGGQISSVCVRRGGCAKHFLSYSQSASIVLS